MNQPTGADSRAHRRARIEAIVAHYPEIAEDQLTELRDYFRKEAAALDLAMIASADDAHAGYERFRAEHIDRFRPGDILRAGAFVAVFSGFIAFIAWHTM